MATYGAMHILVKNEESRRCSSWKDEEGASIRNRTRAQAEEILRGYRKQILDGEKTFEEIARTESDCGSAAQDGNLGTFAEGEVLPPFFDAVSKLKVGEISDIVVTDSGCHIIKRTE